MMKSSSASNSEEKKRRLGLRSALTAKSAPHQHSYLHNLWRIVETQTASASGDVGTVAIHVRKVAPLSDVHHIILGDIDIVSDVEFCLSIARALLPDL